MFCINILPLLVKTKGKREVSLLIKCSVCNQNEIAFAQVKLNNCCNEEYDNVSKIKNSVYITEHKHVFGMREHSL